MKTKNQEAKKLKAKKSNKLLVKSISELKEHDAILFKLKDTYNEVKEGKINSKSELAQPLEAHVVCIENNIIHVRTRSDSYFDLTLKDYIIIKKIRTAKKEDANTDAQKDAIQEEAQESIKEYAQEDAPEED